MKFHGSFFDAFVGLSKISIFYNQKTNAISLENGFYQLKRLFSA